MDGQQEIDSPTPDNSNPIDLEQIKEEQIALIVARKRAEISEFFPGTTPQAGFDAYLRKEAEQQIAYEKDRMLAYADSLNQELHNKLGFQERLVYVIEQAMTRGGVVTILRGDMDNFRDVNSAIGHDRADDLLIGLGNVLLDSAQRRTDTVARFRRNEDGVAEDGEVFDRTKPLLKTDSDLSTAAREGGDEFGAIVPVHELGAMTIARRTQSRFNRLLADPQYEALKDVNPGVSMGIASIDFSQFKTDKTALEIAKMIKERADDALYVAKEERKGSIFIYSETDPRIIAREAQKKAAGTN